MAGLLHLREGTPFALYAHERVLAVLDAQPDLRGRRPRASCRGARWSPDEPVELADAAGDALGLAVAPFLAPGQGAALPRRPRRRRLDTAALDGDTLGLEIDGGRRAGWSISPTARGSTEPVLERVAGADSLFLDGTLWRDDEMIAQGVGREDRAGAWAMSA